MLDTPLNRSMQQLNRQHYRAAVTWTDFNVGRLLKGLDEHKLTSSTAIIFHGDHGWNLGDHGGWYLHNILRISIEMAAFSIEKSTKKVAISIEIRYTPLHRSISTVSGFIHTL